MFKFLVICKKNGDILNDFNTLLEAELFLSRFAYDKEDAERFDIIGKYI